MQVLKTFVADGKKFRPGDTPPEVDKVTIEHYVRHGMVGELPKPEPKKERIAKPSETKPAAPKEAT